MTKRLLAKKEKRRRNYTPKSVQCFLFASVLTARWYEENNIFVDAANSQPNSVLSLLLFQILKFGDIHLKKQSATVLRCG